MTHPRHLFPIHCAIALSLCWVTVAPARTVAETHCRTFASWSNRNEPTVVNISTTQTPNRKAPPASPAFTGQPGADNLSGIFQALLSGSPGIASGAPDQLAGLGFILSPDIIS